MRFSRSSVPLTVPSAPSFPTHGSAGVSVLCLICTTSLYIRRLPVFKKVRVLYIFSSSFLLIMLGSDLPALFSFCTLEAASVCVHVCVRAHVSESLCACMCTHTHVRVCVYVCVCTHVSECVHVCVCAHVSETVCIYVCAHVCMCVCMRVSQSVRARVCVYVVCPVIGEKSFCFVTHFYV